MATQVKIGVVEELVGDPVERPEAPTPHRTDETMSLAMTPAFERVLSCWEAIDSRVRLILRNDGRLLAASNGATEFFSRSPCLVVQGGRVLGASYAANTGIQQLLKTAIGETETVIIPAPMANGHCILRGTGLYADAIAVTVYDASDGFRPLLADLEEVFGLTPSEALVIEKLQQGLNPNSISEDLDISVHTVRAHLRHCYDKLGVSSREELGQKLAPYRLN